MKLSEAIREYVELMIEGEPPYRDWQSIDAAFKARERYQERLAELAQAIDLASPTPKEPG